MAEHVYKIIDLVGSSKIGIEDAIQTAISRADETIRNLRWVEVGPIRGEVKDGKVEFYQVTVKAGFTLDE